MPHSHSIAEKATFRIVKIDAVIEAEVDVFGESGEMNEVIPIRLGIAKSHRYCPNAVGEKFVGVGGEFDQPIPYSDTKILNLERIRSKPLEVFGNYFVNFQISAVLLMFETKFCV